MKAVTFWLVAMIFLTAGCRSKSALDANGVPSTLVVAVYEGDNPGETGPVLKKVKAYFEKKLGIPIEFQESIDYTTVIEAVATGKVHMAYLSPFSYVLATQKQHLVPLVTAGINGQSYSYKSYIFCNPGKGLHSMDDVKARSHSLTFCFADPASTSGHLIPRAYLTTIGLDPKTAFRQTMFAGTHAASLLSVKAGKTDLGCAFQYAYDKMIRDGSLHEGDVTVLWKSDPIPGSPVCMRPEVNAAFTEKVREAFLRMPQDGAEAFHSYMSMYFPKEADQMSYVPVDDSIFNGLRKIAAGIGDLTPTKK